MPSLEVHQFPCLNDNYGYLLHDPDSDLTAAIDTPEVDPINRALEQKGWKLTHILNTHHHFDHAGGNEPLKAKWGCTIVGAARDAKRIPGIDVRLEEGDTYTFGNHDAQIFDVSGHTIGHIAYYFAEDGLLFCGDALFAMGCGRLFEGTPAQMWNSLQKLRDLPDDTVVYCAHEYTQANAKFALSVEPQNDALQARAREVEALRADDRPTVPSTIGVEKATNPFLRPMSEDLQSTIGLAGADLVERLRRNATAQG
ncbi:MAG: hydroxyacylglutathione hydrolase [Gammaproteobacteria bacterium]|nr:hydroxyacylglutathione hydrolase [Gammaproteobacteria bacterium]